MPDLTPGPHTPQPPIRLAVTLGDPAGVGPEIVLAMFAQAQWPAHTAPFVSGEARILEQIARSLGIPADIRIAPQPPTEPPPPGVVPVVEPPDYRFEGPVREGKVDPACGAAAWAYVRHAVDLIQQGRADGVVTAPLHKEALHAAGCPHPGHTEMLADLAGGCHVAMLLVGGGVRVALVTIHEAIARVPQLITRQGILEKIRLLHTFIPWFGLDDGPRPRAPRIGVTGLNPHAGEGGMFGDEEIQTIIPAIEAARAEGIDATGPLPADTAFHFHREGHTDAILAMYHDQGLIPVKTLDFHLGVNVSMGLPFIRTSVDHGTAFDIAGKGIARPDSLRAALHTAATLTANRRRTAH